VGRQQGNDVKMKPSTETEQAKAEIAELLRQYAAKYLNDEFSVYCIELLDRLSRKRNISITSGRKEIWASAIICVIARLNFLYDKTNPHHITKESICEFFTTKSTTVGQKATAIENACKIGMAEPGLCSSELSDRFTFFQLPNGLIITKQMAAEMGMVIE
jgi:hypothetical protein